MELLENYKNKNFKEFSDGIIIFITVLIIDGGYHRSREKYSSILRLLSKNSHTTHLLFYLFHEKWS
jgi:hypothetical protein